MHFISPEQRERHSYIEQSIDKALEEFKEPETIRALGDFATCGAKRLENAIITNFKDGQIKIPQDYLESEELPIAAVSYGETFAQSADFDHQVSSQRQATEEILQRWQPALGLTARQIRKKHIGTNISVPGPSITLDDLTIASTSTTAKLFKFDGKFGSIFEKPPKGVVVIKMRPCLIYGLEESKHALPENTAHELVHVSQIESNPVTVYRSQRAADMNALRLELEAYHLGAYFTLRRYKKTGVQSDSGLIQLAVDMERMRSNPTEFDPFRPSGRLLNDLKAMGLDDILHMKANYDAIKIELDRHEQSLNLAEFELRL